MKIFGWSDGGSACEWYRLRVPLEEIARHEDVDVRVAGMFDLDFEPDVIIGQRVSMDGPTELWRQFSEIKTGWKPRLVYELDDDLFNVAPSNPVFAHYNQLRVRQNIRQNMARADAIVVSTEALRQRVILELGRYPALPAPPVHVLRNSLPEIAYRNPQPGLVQSQDVTIGWAGSSTHAEDFDELAAPLARFLRQDAGARFLTMGASFPDVERRIAELQYDKAPWVSDMAEYYRALDRFDVGVIPLRPSVFNQSKSDIKFLELAARRVPVIMSNVGPYVEHHTLGDVVNQPHQWTLWLRAWAQMLRDGYDPELHTEIAYDYACSRSIWHAWRGWWEVINA